MRRLALGLLACCAGMALGCHGGERMTFVLEWEGVDPAMGQYPPTLVLTETRSLSFLVPDSPVNTSLGSANVAVVLGDRLLCDVPKLSYGLLVPPVLVVGVAEHRLTVFTPGYAAATVYPEGLYNARVGEAINPYDRPTLLRAENYVIGTHRNAIDTFLELRGEEDGRESYCLRLRKLPLKKPLPRLNSAWSLGSIYDEVYTFYSQVASLDEAIAAGCLRGAGPEERRLLAEAIRLEHDAFVSTLAEPAYMVETMRPEYQRIQKWAGVPVSSGG
jgi:hypothetical protein